MYSLIECADIQKGANNTGKSASRIGQVISSIKHYATLAEAMRIVGAGIMLSAISIMLLKGWHDGNDIHRYLKLLSMTGLMTLGGLVLSFFLKEQKGARMFFGLAHISVPANFGILGGLILSQFPEFGLNTNYPQFAKWAIMDSTNIIVIACGALAVLLPVSLLGFRILDRSSATLFTAAFFGLNMLLLIPIRDSLMVSVPIAIALFIPIYIAKLASKQRTVICTKSYRYSQTLLFIPALVLLTRNLYLYDLNGLVGFVACGGIYLTLRLACRELEPKSLFKTFAEVASGPVILGAALGLSAFVSSVSSDLVSGFAFCAVLGLHMVDMHLRKDCQSLVRMMSISASTLLIGLVISLSILFNHSTLDLVIHIFASLSLIGFGIWARRRVPSIVGSLLLIASLWIGLEDLIRSLFSGNWVMMAIAGSLVILAASVVDRYGAVIKLTMSEWFNIKSRQQNIELEK